MTSYDNISLRISHYSYRLGEKDRFIQQAFAALLMFDDMQMCYCFMFRSQELCVKVDEYDTHLLNPKKGH